MNKTFTSHGYEYEQLISGAIRQLNPEPFIYDATYCATYDTDAYRRGNEILQALRYGFATAVHDRSIYSITDIGYGNGAFMHFAKQHSRYVTGYDVTGIEVDGCATYKMQDHHRMASTMHEVDVITFFDCLEHIPDISFLSNLPCETLIVSLPYCHMRQQGQSWFDTMYKHRKPNEHVWHFDYTALVNTLKQYGWSLKSVSGIEDIVRKSEHGLQNILTCGFKR